MLKLWQAMDITDLQQTVATEVNIRQRFPIALVSEVLVIVNSSNVQVCLCEVNGVDLISRETKFHETVEMKNAVKRSDPIVVCLQSSQVY
jgi:putative ribosome biogenesis GTPase RsgA